MRKYTSNKIPLDATHAICIDCNQEQSIDNFSMNNSHGCVGYRRSCKTCCTKRYMIKNMQPLLRAQRLCACAIQRSKKIEKYKYECDLTPEWIQERIEYGKCAVTNINFVLTIGHHPFSPSLDRIDSSKGYTKDNIQIVVLIYNTAKRQFKHEDVMKLASALIYGHK